MTVFSPRLLAETGTPVDQPLLSHCGICHEVVIYIITDKGYGRGGLGDGGQILQPWCERGLPWIITADGTYVNRKNSAKKKGLWGQRGHRCPQKALMALRADTRLYWRTEKTA